MILFVCLIHGFVRDSIITWAPAMMQTTNISADIIRNISLIIPAINLAGIFCGYIIENKFRSNHYIALAILFIISGLASFVLYLHHSSLLFLALFLGICCASMYGMNPILTGMIPMEYEKTGHVGMMAGLFDCVIYMGSALAGVITGAIFEKNSKNIIYLLFLIVSALCFVLCLLSSQKAMPLESRRNRL